jgi:hypothetical protein
MNTAAYPMLLWTKANVAFLKAHRVEIDTKAKGARNVSIARRHSDPSIQVPIIAQLSLGENEEADDDDDDVEQRVDDTKKATEETSNETSTGKKVSKTPPSSSKTSLPPLQGISDAVAADESQDIVTPLPSSPKSPSFLSSSSSQEGNSILSSPESRSPSRSPSSSKSVVLGVDHLDHPRETRKKK